MGKHYAFRLPMIKDGKIKVNSVVILEMKKPGKFLETGISHPLAEAEYMFRVII